MVRDFLVRLGLCYNLFTGNIHLNVIADSYAPEIQEALEPFVYKFVASHRGSISAE